MTKPFLRYLMLMLSFVALMPVEAEEIINFSEEDRLRAFKGEEESTEVCFVLDTALWGVNATSVYVAGSFNGWNKEAADYKMTFGEGLWTLNVPVAELNIPGGSGYPEFKFVADGEYLNLPDFVPEGYRFDNRNNAHVLSLTKQSVKFVRQNNKKAAKIKSISDFELTGKKGQSQISNFRQVPGTKYLYRSYHPFKASFVENTTEIYRLRFASELAETYGIASDICLSGDETEDLRMYKINHSELIETVPDYYRSIISKGDVLYVGKAYAEPSYEEVYYNSGGQLFGLWVKDIVDFIIDDRHPIPFSIHCRLGTDRTGVFCAVLAGLCGATWDEIAEDYAKSSEMGIGEFRSPLLLKYSLNNMLNADVEEIKDLQGALSAYFINNKYLTQEKINLLNDRLK